MAQEKDFEKIENYLKIKCMKFVKKWKFVIGGIVAVLIVGILAFIFWPKGSAAQTTQTTKVTKASISQRIEVSGQITSQHTQNAGFNSAGKVTDIKVKVGDQVKAGQVLATIDPSTLQNTLAQSQSSLQVAKNNLNNTYAKGKYSSYDILNLKEQIKSAEAKVATDQQNLDNASLKAQYDGTIMKINAKIGDTVTAVGSNSLDTATAQSNAVMVVSDTKSLMVNSTVSESDISKVAKDQLVEITFDSIKNKTYTAKVTDVDLLGQSTSGVVAFSVKILLDKPDASIRIGMNANASIITQQKNDILTVPNTYLRTINGVKYVTVIENGAQVQKEVTVGITDDVNTEIVDGVTENEEIIRVTTTTTRTSSATGGLSILGGTGARPQNNFVGR